MIVSYKTGPLPDMLRTVKPCPFSSGCRSQYFSRPVYLISGTLVRPLVRVETLVSVVGGRLSFHAVQCPLQLSSKSGQGKVYPGE